MAELNVMLNEVYFLDHLSVDHLEMVCRSLRLKQYDADEKIIREGKVGNTFYLLYSGSVRVYQGKTLFRLGESVGDLGQGDFFGEVALIRHEPRNATVVCLEPCEVFTLARSAFETICEDNKEFKIAVGAIANQRKTHD